MNYLNNLKKNDKVHIIATPLNIDHRIGIDDFASYIELTGTVTYYEEGSSTAKIRLQNNYANPVLNGGNYYLSNIVFEKLS